MTIFFTEEEKDWIDKKTFDWQIKNGCPKRIKKNLSKKIKLLHDAGREDYYGPTIEKL